MALLSCCTLFAYSGLELGPKYHLTEPAAGALGGQSLFWIRGNAATPMPSFAYHTLIGGGRHAVSDDLVRWRSLPSSTVASPTGGVGVVGDHVAARGATLASVFSNDGLSLWLSEDEALTEWSQYGSSAVLSRNLIPSTLKPGFLGSSAVWSATTNATTRFYALVASSVCPDGTLAWCGAATPNATQATLLFASEDLVTWKFVSQFFTAAAPSASGAHLSSVDTFALENGVQVLMTRATDGTLEWSLGSLSPSTMTFAPVADVSTSADKGSVVFGAASLRDPFGRRVQLAWANISDALYVQTLPRTIAPRATGLAFAPLRSAVWTLHSGAARVPLARQNLAPGATVDLSADLAFAPLQLHLAFELALPRCASGAFERAPSVTIEVLGGLAAGGATIVVAQAPVAPAPAPATCTSLPIASGSDTSGVGVVAPIAMNATLFGIEGARLCQSYCCANPQCEFFTFTDPQPGTGGKQHVCYLKGGKGGVVPGGPGCTGGSDPSAGHCWSGARAGVPRPPMVLTVNGVESALADNTPPPLTNTTASTTWTALLDVFVDGAIVEVFANDGAVAQTLSTAGAIAATYSIGASSSTTKALAHASLSAWKMAV